MDATETEVVAVRDVGGDAVAIDLATPEGFDARPGQFVKLTATVDGERESRFYTISSAAVTDRFETTVEVDPEGSLAPWLAAREPGDRVAVEGPYGQEYYGGEPSVLVLAGGLGVGLAVGIAEAALADGNRVAVVYLDDDTIHEDRLAAAAAGGAVVFLLRDADRVADAVASVIEADQQAFVYGFAEFIDTAVSAIAAAGGDPDRAKIENFG
jgi:3-phenylpropionate/trans-cinnamate dioxygenase ferredoxin reductase subunit